MNNSSMRDFVSAEERLRNEVSFNKYDALAVIFIVFVAAFLGAK